MGSLCKDYLDLEMCTSESLLLGTSTFNLHPLPTLAALLTIQMHFVVYNYRLLPIFFSVYSVSLLYPVHLWSGLP